MELPRCLKQTYFIIIIESDYFIGIAININAYLFQTSSVYKQI